MESRSASSPDPTAGSQSAKLTDEDRGLAIHSPAQQVRHVSLLLLALLALSALAMLVFWVPFRSSWSSVFLGDLDLHSTIENVGALFGLVVGYALIQRFTVLGNRFHLFIGLAFLLSGLRELVHGLLLCFRQLLIISDNNLIDTLAETYLTGQLLLGIGLLMALHLPSWQERLAPGRRGLRVSLTAFALVMALPVALLVPLPGLMYPKAFVFQPLQWICLLLLAITTAAYLGRYLREREMFYWWMALSLGVNTVGQAMTTLFSSQPLDAFLEIAHIYRVLGLLIPLVGFFHYQISVLLEYQRIQRELIAAREAALTATRAKSEFLANVSHELRTPMNGILGMTGRALRTELSATQRDYLTTVRDSADHLLTLLNDLLDFSKIEAGKLELFPKVLELRQWLAETIGTVAALAHEKGLSLQCDVADEVPQQLLADADRLRQILLNLLGNAIKFTDGGSVRVEVSLDGGAESRPMLHVCVSDTGIGVAPEKQQEIFEAFRQADGTSTRRFGGTGLGLAISAQLIRMMAGRIWVESQTGAGSRFHFTIPCCPASELTAGQAEEERVRTDESSPVPTVSQEPRRILLAEDNEVNRRVAAGMLEDLGHQVLLASDGRMALALLEEQDVDIVLMDLQMPEMGGLEATAVIRKREQETGGHLPIIALTAHALKGDRERCLAAGMDGYLAKPLREDELFQAIEGQSPGRATGEVTVKPAGAVETLFDADQALEQFRGQTGVLAEIIALFGEQSEALLAEMDQALQMQDCPAAARIAHTLGGSAANFHSAVVNRCTRTLESAARAQQLDEAWRAFRELAVNVRRLRAELSAWCDRL